MKKTILEIQGGDAANFARQYVKERSPATVAVFDENAIVICGEKYFMRTGSDLMYTLACLPRSDVLFLVYIMVGGGGTSAARFTLGAERSWLQTLVERISAICENNGWEMREKTASA